VALCLVKQGFGQRSPDERGDTGMEFKDLVVIVLAGNDENPDLLGGSGQPSKFFMPFGHETVGDRILRAVDGLNCCKSIYLAVPLGSANRQDFTTERPLHLVSEGATRTESVMNTVREAERQGDYVGGDYVLVITGDLPLLSSSALDRLIEACEGADEADLYLGMIPLSAVAEELRQAYQTALLPYCDGVYLHSDVCLLRPDAVSEAGRNRFEEYMSVRRAHLNSLGSILRVSVTLLRIVGLRRLFPLARVIAGLRARDRGDPDRALSALEGVDRLLPSLVEEKFGLRVGLVTVHEPGLALDFDYVEQLRLLEEWAPSIA